MGLISRVAAGHGSEIGSRFSSGRVDDLFNSDEEIVLGVGGSGSGHGYWGGVLMNFMSRGVRRLQVELNCSSQYHSAPVTEPVTM